MKKQKRTGIPHTQYVEIRNLIYRLLFPVKFDIYPGYDLKSDEIFHDTRKALF